MLAYLPFNARGCLRHSQGAAAALMAREARFRFLSAAFRPVCGAAAGDGRRRHAAPSDDDLYHYRAVWPSAAGFHFRSARRSIWTARSAGGIPPQPAGGTRRPARGVKVAPPADDEFFRRRRRRGQFLHPDALPAGMMLSAVAGQVTVSYSLCHPLGRGQGLNRLAAR